MRDYTKKQGETFKFTLALVDTNGAYVKIAEDVSTPLMYFGGVASKDSVDVAISFKYGPLETRTTALGEEEAIYTVICYISADATSGMVSGGWTYAVRMSETVNPVDDDNVKVLQNGTLSILESLYSVDAATEYSIPTS